MRIAIASGKGGVGKTTFAAALAMTAARNGLSTVYADCDVEAPNGHLLLHPAIDQKQPVTRPIPTVDPDKCRHCGACERACQFGAIICLPTTVQVNANLCKSCGACGRACPHHAIHGVARSVGYVESGHVESLTFIQGVLDVGQARSIPIIDAVRAAVPASADLVIVDAPPGTSCPMVTAVRSADLVVLIAEPTAFGLADLTLAVDTMQIVGAPVAVIINRCDRGDARVREFCRARGLPILAEVPYSQALAGGYAHGSLNHIIDALDDWPGELLAQLLAMRTSKAS